MATGSLLPIISIWDNSKTWHILYRCYINYHFQARMQGYVSQSHALECGIHQRGFLLLVRYNDFINSFLVSLKQSGSCCKVYLTQVHPWVTRMT